MSGTGKRDDGMLDGGLSSFERWYLNSSASGLSTQDDLEALRTVFNAGWVARGPVHASTIALAETRGREEGYKRFIDPITADRDQWRSLALELGEALKDVCSPQAHAALAKLDKMKGEG